MVCNDPRVAQYIRENFVAVANNDLEYVNRQETDRAEYRIMQKIYAQSPYPEAYQGIMLASSSGKLFDHYTDFDPDSALAALKAAKRDYDEMPKSERVLAEQIGPKDALPTWSPSREGIIDIRVTKRTMPDPRLPTNDQRHPMYFHFDYLWLKTTELRDFVPKKVAVGETRMLDTKYVQRFGVTNLLTPEGQAWVLEDLKKGSLKTTITAVEADGIHLRLDGEFHLDAQRDSNDSRYDGRLIGHFIVSRNLRSMVAFEAVALGEAEVRTLNSALHPGPGDTLAGAVFRINGSTPNDQMVPSGWHVAYRDF